MFETPFSHGRMPGIQIHAAVADQILSKRFMRAGARRASGSRPCWRRASRSASPRRSMPAWWATLAALACLSLGGWAATRLFAGGYWMNASQPMLTSAVRAVRRRRLSVLRRGPREAEDEEAVRPVRLEGRLRSAGGESGAGAARRPAARDDACSSRTSAASPRSPRKAQPEDIVHMLNEYFTRMVDDRVPSQGHGGQVRRRHGDGAVRRAARRSRSTPSTPSRRRSK